MPRVKRKSVTVRLVDEDGAYDYTEMNPVPGWRVRRDVHVTGDLFGQGIGDQDIEDSFEVFALFRAHRWTLTTCHEARWLALQPQLQLGRHVRVLVDTQGDS